jgi:hypothetical protein
LGDVTIECTEALPTEEPHVSDNCGAVTLGESQNRIDGSCSSSYTLVREFEATDSCGTKSSSSQTVVVQDTTDPVITPPADQTAECNAIPQQSSTHWTASADCNSQVSDFVCVTSVSDHLCPHSYVQELICSVSDECGNSDTATHSLKIEDTTSPTIAFRDGGEHITVSSLSDPLLELDASAAFVFATDNCDNNPVLARVLSSDKPSCDGDWVHTYRATDACGNFGEATQTLTIVDDTLPEFDCEPENVTVECDEIPTNRVVNTLTGEPVSHTVTPDGQRPIIHTWTAEDCAGNVKVHSQTIVVQDTTKPFFSRLPESETVECNCESFPSAPQLTAIDNCDDVPVQLTEASTKQNDSDHDFEITRTWSVADTSGNQATHVQIITVQDTTPPSFDLFSSVVNVAMDASSPPVFAHDDCDENPTQTTISSDTSSTKCTRTTVTTYRSTDSSGNSADFTQSVVETDFLCTE